MSTSAVSPMAQSGLLAQLVANSAAAQKQVDDLTLETSSGLRSQTYGGLGAEAGVSLDLRPQMAEIGAWQQNISSAGTALDTTQSVLGQLHGIASTFSADAIGADLQTGTGVSALAGQAQQALAQVEGLLNTQQNGAYAFSGTQSQTAPIDASALSGFASSVAGIVAGLSTGSSASSVMSSAISAGSTAAFTWPGLSVSGTTPAALGVPVGRNTTLSVGFVAGRNSFAPPAGGGTGSYVRDLVTGLAALAGLSGTTAGSGTLQSFGASVSSLLTGTADTIGTEEAGFGGVQDQAGSQGTALSDTLTSLTRQVSSVEDTDMTSTATALSQVQTQLEASYKLIAALSNLSLVAYL